MIHGFDNCLVLGSAIMSLYIQQVPSISGTVTHVNYEFYTFELETGWTIICGWYLKSKSIQMPALSDNVELRRVYKTNLDNKTLYMLEPSELTVINEESLVETTYNNRFILFLLRTNFEFEQVCGIYQILEQINYLSSELKYALFDYFHELNGNKSLPEVFTPKHFDLNEERVVKYIKMLEMNKYKHCIYYSRNADFLIGFIRVDAYSSYMLLNFENGNVILEIIAESNRFNLVKFNNRYVIIKKFLVVVEIFNNFRTTKCVVLAQENDIALLKTKKQTSERVVFALCGEDVAPTSRYNEVFSFKLLIKGVPNSTPGKTIECWLTGKMMSVNRHNFKVGEIFNLGLHSSYLNILPFLEVGDVYKLLIKSEGLYKDREYEIYNIDRSRSNYKLQKDSAYFVRLKTESNPGFADLPTGNVKDFQAIILKKELEPPDKSSRTYKHMNVDFLGTQGDFTHTLHVELLETSLDKKRTKLFLNNWERRLTPILLIPNMVVMLRSVTYRTNHLRSNGMTTFSVVKYLPEFPYNNWSLFTRIPSDHFIANIASVLSIPRREVCVASLTLQALISIKLIETAEKNEIVMEFLVSDAVGRAVLRCNNLMILKDVFELSKPSFFEYHKVLEKYLAAHITDERKESDVAAALDDTSDRSLNWSDWDDEMFEEKQPCNHLTDEETIRSLTARIKIVTVEHETTDTISRFLNDLINDRWIRCKVMVQRIGTYELAEIEKTAPLIDQKQDTKSKHEFHRKIKTELPHWTVIEIFD